MATYHQRHARANLTKNLFDRLPRIHWGATALAGLFAGGTAFVLFEDVMRHGAPLTVAHIQTALALIGTIAAGHYCWPELKAKHFAAAAGCALVFAGGTFYIATASGARQAFLAEQKAAAADKLNTARTVALRKAENAEAEAQTAKERHERKSERAEEECASGKGKKCDGRNATRDAAAQDAERAEARAKQQRAAFDALEPTADRSGGYAQAAATFAALPFVTARAVEIEKRIKLIMPFLLVMIAEVGLMTFASMSLRRIGPSSADTRQTSFAAPSEADYAIPVGDWPEPPKPGARAKTEQRERAVRDFVGAYRDRHGRDPEPREVRAAVNLPRSTAHRYQRRIA